MSQPVSLASFFSGGGGKSISWKDKPLGTRAGGRIKAIQPPSQVTDLVTKEPKFKKNGEPVMHVRIDLQTNERDPQDAEDDGTRSLYCQGWLIGAIGDALRRAGAGDTPQVGADLYVTLIERTPPETPGLNPTNKFTAEYTPPAVTGQFFAQQPVQQPVYQAPVPQYAPAPGGYAAPPPAYVQPPVQQAPPVQVAAPPVAPLPPKPESLAQAAWDTMPDDVKRSVAATFAGLPPF